MAQGRLTLALAQSALRWYRDAGEFHSHMESFVRRAAEGGADIVAFPEDVGLPLAVVEDLSAIAQTASLAEAAEQLVALRHTELAPLMARYSIGPLRAYLLWRGEWMREVYQSTFSALAREHGITVVAGSIPLPEAGADDGCVYNTAHVYGPHGQLLGRQRKVHLIDLEAEQGLDLCTAPPEEYRVVRTEKCVLGVAICLDCFDAELVAALVRQGMELLIDVKANPKEFTPEEQADNRRSAWSRCQERPIYAAQVFAVGNLLGLPFRGRSAVYCNARLTPDGSGVLAQAQSDCAEELLVAELDLGLLAEVAP